MEFVQPIRDRKKLEAIKTYLLGSNPRDYCLFVLGINTALRISDLLKLTVGDVYDKGKVKERIELREQKTGKSKVFPLGQNAKTAINTYMHTRFLTPDSSKEPLFPSRKGGGVRPVQRIQVWKSLNRASHAVGITDRIGTHTMRKTFGYWAYQDGKDITLLQQLLNHHSPATTLRYIGITQDDLDNIYLKINL